MTMIMGDDDDDDADEEEEEEEDADEEEEEEGVRVCSWVRRPPPHVSSTVSCTM